LEGLDLSQPEAIKERIFGKILRVDRVQQPGHDQLTLELNDFVRAVRGLSRPKVGGHDALRAMRVADQVLRSLQTHTWDARPGDHSRPHDLAAPAPAAGHTLRGPISWRVQGARPAPVPPPGA
jgi:hypothetical protein